MRPAEFVRSALLALLALWLCGCASQPVAAPNPLPSWTAGPVKSRLLDFVAAATDPASATWVDPADRIAVVDHDGTLIVEQPRPVQMDFIFDRIVALAPGHPEWAGKQPFAAVMQQDWNSLDALGFRGSAPLMDAAQAGLSGEAYAEAAKTFLENSRDARFGRRYTELVYQPVRELVALLQARDFRVFIVSSGGAEFIRALAEPVYGIASERVIGSRMKTELREVDGRLEVLRKPGFAGLNVASFKALNIDALVGRRPVIAIGNSDGDLQMLQYTDTGPASLVVLLEHDDAQREYDYAQDSVKVRAMAAKRNWLQVSMARDFLQIFPESAK